MSKYIECHYVGRNGTSLQFMTAKEIVAERTRMCNEAAAAIRECKDPSIRHIVYYRDRRRDNDTIWKAFFYVSLVGLNDADFYQRTEEVGSDGFIGAVHKNT